jgi:hypothetical protein
VRVHILIYILTHNKTATLFDEGILIGLQCSTYFLFSLSLEFTMTSQTKSKKKIIFNAFDQFTVGHMSFGQWRNPKDRSADKRRDLTYWTDLAKILEKGDFNAIFLADTFGWSDVYKGTAEPCVRTAIQYPMGDPVIPVSAMAAVTKNLGFAITSSTSFDSPYVLAKRFSTLDHLTGGRFGWNIVTSWKASGFKAVRVRST